MRYEELKASTCAGIVLYNPDIVKLKRNIETLINQTDCIICVDNNSANRKDIYELVSSFSTVSVMSNEKNMGIAYALNQILRFADSKGYRWFISMDQDSCCSESLLFEYANNMPNSEDVAILSPYILNNGKVSIEEYKKMGLPSIQEIVDPIDCITSGCLNNVIAAKRIRGYKSKLFIDCVDVDFNLRHMLLHQKIYRVNSAYMLQEMGKAKEVRLIQFLYRITGKNVFRRLRYAPEYSETRLYYISRNSDYIYRKYGKLAGKRMTPSWMTFQYVYYLLSYPINRNRISMIKSILKGKKDSKRMR